MSRSKQDKLRDQRLKSGPSTKLVSRGGKSSSGKSRRRKGSSHGGGLYSNNGQSQKQRSPYSRKQMTVMVIILIAFICGILMGAAYMFGDFDKQVNPEPQYQNVTKNISQYHESDNVTYEINETELNNTTVKNNIHIRNRTDSQ